LWVLFVFFLRLIIFNQMTQQAKPARSSHSHFVGAFLFFPCV